MYKFKSYTLCNNLKIVCLGKYYQRNSEKDEIAEVSTNFNSIT